MVHLLHQQAIRTSIVDELTTLTRYELYTYTNNTDAVHTYSDSYYNNGHLEVQKRIDKYGERISRFCKVSSLYKGRYPVNGTFEPEVDVYDIEVEQTPAFLMMVLAELAAKNYHTKIDGIDKIVSYVKCEDEDTFTIFKIPVSFYVADAYEKAKDEFVYSASESAGGIAEFLNLGGLTHPHMTGTYYFLSNDYYNKLEVEGA